MPTPSIQTLVTDAQQILNLDSISAVRSVVAVALANANTGTPLNPNLTTQQLWNEFYQVVNKPKSDIESIIANQLMKMLYAPPAPGGAGANKQVIFNDGGVLAGDAGLTYDKATDALKIAGLLGIGGDGISPLTVYAAGSAKAPALLLTTVGSPTYGWDFSVDGAVNGNLFIRRLVAGVKTDVLEFDRANGNVGLGMTPSAWTPQFKALQISPNAAISTVSTATIIGTNWFSGSGGDTYLNNGFSTLYVQNLGTHQWYTAPSGLAGLPSAFVNTLSLDANGNLTANVGNIALGTSGKGIDFSATPSGSGTMTSELFNDYEEGTWTGTLKGSATDPTTPITATGKYTKIGRQVTVEIYINGNTTGASGRIFVSGLPFTPSNAPVDGRTGSVLFDGMATFTGSPVAWIGASNTTIDMYQSINGGATTAVTHNTGANRSLWVCATYTV
jgi:hypothetical protein